MNYKKQEIKKGINLHTIKTDKFKTNLLAVFLTMPLTRETVTIQSLIPAVLTRGSKNMKTADEISKSLEEMYGADFDCGIDKMGDNQVLKFYLEVLDNNYLPENKDLLNEAIDKLFDIIFNPLVDNDEFKEEYVNSEKEKLRQIIEGKIDNKASYAYIRCLEEMYKDKPYGLYKYGYVEDLDDIDSKKLYKAYKDVINNCKMDIFISGQIPEDINKSIEQKLQNINEREAKYIVNEKEENKKQDEKIIKEEMDVAQGKLVMGLNVDVNTKEARYVALVYNAIFGGIPTSKLFQNVREKASLAYTASSSYLRQKNNIFVKCGIEIENYEKAVKIIKEQLEDMKKGNFTDEDIESAKNNIIAVVKCIPDEQDTSITYYFGQELSKFKMEFDEYSENIQKVTKQQIIDLAQNVYIDIIYFLKGVTNGDN